MKKIVIYVIFSIIYLVASWFAYYSFSGSNLLMLFVTLMGTTLVLLFGSNFLLNYHGKATWKFVLIHAGMLAIIACGISIALILGQEADEEFTSARVAIESLSKEDAHDGDAEWETVIDEQDAGSRVMQIGFDFFIAMLGGISALKLYERKYINSFKDKDHIKNFSREKYKQ